MPRDDKGGRDEYGMRNSHAKSDLRENKVISLDDWIKEERESIIRRAKDADERGYEETPPPQDERDPYESEEAYGGESDMLDGEQPEEPEYGDGMSEDEPFFEPDEDERPAKKRRKKERKRRDRRRRGEAAEQPEGELEYEPQEEPPEELSPEERARALKRKRIARVIGLFVFLAMLVAGALLAYFLLIVDSIVISGNESYSDEEILAVSGLHTGTHIWLNDVDGAKRAIETDPYIKEAAITRVYPDRITVKITERHEYAVIISLNTNAVIDEEGYVLEIGHRSDYDGLLTVYGTGAGGYHVNQRLGEESNFSSRTLTTMLSALIATGMSDEIESVDISNPLSIYMVTYDGLKVQVGQPQEVEDKLLKMRAVMDKLRSMGYANSGTLDLSAKGDPVYSPPGASTTIIGAVQPTAGGTPDPNATPNPDGTPLPDVTPNPDSTPVPDVTPNPDGTPVPATGSSPTPTDGAPPSPSPTQYYTGEPGFSG